MLAIKHLYVVQSIGGGRGDFVAGWLGTAPNFVDVQWTIDVETGKSTILSNFIKEVHATGTASALGDVLNSYGYCLDDQSDYSLSSTCVKENIQNFILPNLKKQVKIVIIDTDDADPQDLLWQYVVKTFMVKTRTQWFLDHGQIWGVDHELVSRKLAISDQNRIDFVLDTINNWQFRSYPVAAEVPTVTIKYNDLFQLGGSRMLTNALDIDVSNYHHNYWNTALSLANAPDRIFRWGKVWDKQEIMQQKNINSFKIVEKKNQISHRP